MGETQPPAPGERKLNEEEQALVAAWYEQHGEQIVREVRRWLRKVTEARTGASASAVAQSVWASFMENRLDEIDPSDENSAWAVLATAARRHCEAWNRYGTRHPQLSMEGMTGLDPEAPGEVSPEVLVMVNECAHVFRSLSPDEARGAGHAIARDDRSLQLVERLSLPEREVLGLKLAGKTRDEIADQLQGVDHTQVDALWKSVRAKARALGGEAPR